MLKKIRNRVVAVLIMLVCGLDDVSCSVVGPYVVPTVVCFGNDVSKNDVTEVLNDVKDKNWSDLEGLAKIKGWDLVSCIMDEVIATNTGLKANAAEFRTMHAVEFRAARVGQ